MGVSHGNCLHLVRNLPQAVQVIMFLSSEVKAGKLPFLLCLLVVRVHSAVITVESPTRADGLQLILNGLPEMGLWEVLQHWARLQFWCQEAVFLLGS